MRAFHGTNDKYVASIAVDASTIRDVTVATAVYATRESEIIVLDSILEYSRSENVRFVPFKSKSHHFDKNRDSEFFESVISENESWMRSFYFQHHSSSQNQHYVEAVLTAILAYNVLKTVDRPTFVLIDGDRRKADDFARAFAGFGGTPPTTANCYQSELYYPHALLADLTAGYLANKVSTDEYDHIDPVLRTLPADRKQSDAWGKAFNYLRTKSEPTYQRLGAESAYGRTDKERAKVWFSGRIGKTPESESPEVSLITIIRYLEKRGHGDVANRFREL